LAGLVPERQDFYIFENHQILDEILENQTFKTERLVKNQNVGQKSKCCSKIKILVKNQNFHQ